MICNSNARNNGKLLAAIIAMLMVACAVAVVAMPSSDAYTPVEGGTIDANTSIDSADDLESKAVDGVIDIDAATTITLNADIGSAEDPVDVAFILNANLTIKSAEGKNYNIYIATTNVTVENGSNQYSSVIYYGADNLTFAVENANVYLDNASQNLRTKAIFNSQYGVTGGYNATVSVTNGDLILSQTGTIASGGSGTAWIAATGEDKKSYINLNNGDLVCNGTAAFQDTVITTTGTANTITMNDVEVGLVAADGSKIDNLTYTVNGANVQGLAFKGVVSVENSTFDINDANENNNASRAGVMLYGGSAVTMDETSKISADSVKVAGSNWNGDLDATEDSSLTMPVVTGGTIEGATFMASTGTGDIPSASYTLDGTTLAGTSTVNAGVTLAAGANGITVADNLRNRGTVDTGTGVGLVVDGRFTNSSNVQGTTPITGSGSVTNDTTGNMGVAVESPGYVNNNTSDLTVYGDSTGTNWYPARQNITVPEGQTWTIIEGNVIVIPGTLNVLGNLVIEEGGVLIIGGSVCGDDTTRVGFGTANVEGNLTVEEGAVLAVAYGTLNVEGSANIDGSVMVGYGLKDNTDAVLSAGFIDASTGALTSGVVQSDKATVNLNSNTTLSETSYLYQVENSKIVVAQDVTLTLEGQFESDVSFDNSGSVIINSEPTDDEGNVIYTAAAITVMMMADGASLEVQNLAVGTPGYVYIQDDNLVYKKDTTIAANGSANLLSFNPENNRSVISGLTVVENVSYDRVKDKLTNTMDISGNISGELEAPADSTTADNRTAAYIWLSKGSFTISDAGDANALSLGERVVLDNDATLTVSGYVPVNDTAKVDNAGTVTLAGNGHIYMPEFEIQGTVNAAHYITTVNADDYSNYVTVDVAIAAANADSAIDEIVLYGKNTVMTSATVPAIDFTFKDANTALYIGDEDNRDVRLDIAAGANYGRVGTTYVLGTLYFNDRTDLKASEDTIEADVVSKQVDADGKLTKNGWAMYTNIYTAMTEANPGDIINVFDDTQVVLDRDFTVKEGVTLIVPIDSQIKINDGVTLTVAGTLQSERTNEGIVAETAFGKEASAEDGKEASAIVVTGILKVMENVVYENSTATTKNTLDDGSYISGAYFTDGDYHYVTTVATAVSADVLPTILDEIVIYGTVAEGDIAFAATDDCATIRIGAGAEVTLSSLTLSNEAALDSEATGVFTGTVTVGDASIAAVKVKGLDVESAAGLTVTGADVNYVDTNDKDQKNQATLNVTAGTVIVSSVNAATATITGDVTVDTGATLTVPATSTSVTSTYGTIDGKLFVDGTVTVSSGQTLTVDDLFVDGTVTVAAADGTTTNGTLTVTSGIMYVGLDDEFAVTSTTAAVNGTVGCNTIYAAAGNTVAVDADVFENSTEYYVEDALWITAYTSTADLAIDGGSLETVIKDAAPVENAYFGGTWLDSDGISANDKYVGQVDAVYAQIVYDVYVINLRADQNAVSSITIDGNIMQFGMIEGAGGFYYGYTAVVAAGSHTIQYQLANGYSGEGVLSVNGTQQSGLTFTTEGQPTETASGYSTPVKTYNLQLTGFEKSGYVPDSPDTPTDTGSSDEGMTITDYLLIILVVLIIVMAIIVAMRLMRS